MAQYTNSSRSTWLGKPVKPLARCPRCGYCEHVAAIERNRCRSCREVKAGLIPVSPAIGTPLPTAW